MKASVLILLLVLSAASMGAAAVLLLDARPGHATAAKSGGADLPEFRWGEGIEASMTPVSKTSER